MLLLFVTILAVHFFLVTACIAQHAFKDLYEMRAICQRFSSTLDSCIAMTWRKSRPVGGGGGTSRIDRDDSLTIVGRGQP
jgi:hypothetical protein